MKDKKKKGRKDTAFLLTGTGSRTCLLHAGTWLYNWQPLFP